VGHGIGKKQHPAEQTHILAAMIQLFPVGPDVLYAVDYTGAISNFIYAMDQLRKSRRNGRNCIYETEVQGGGMSFKCFHNRVTQKDGLLDDSILTISPH
jgi:hypothetical protein